MQRDSGTTLSELRVDGGATANNLLMQIQADVLGVPVGGRRCSKRRRSARRISAGLAVGYWKGDDEIAANWRVDRRFEPNTGAPAARSRDRWNDAVSRAKGWSQAR
jgi:glycerol kinase